MIYEYAVSPALFGDIHNIAFLYEAFGIDRGRLISEFPRKREWSKYARHFISKCARDQIERNALIELLIAFERKALYERQRTHWDNQKNWIENALYENEQRAFRGILNHDPVDDQKGVMTIGNTWRATQWNNPQSISVSRTAPNLVQAAMPLISLSTTLVLIDRNFEPTDARFSKVLIEFANQILRQKHQPKITLIKYVTTYESDKNAPRTINMFESDCRTALTSSLPRGISVKFIIKVKKLLHDRFVLTDRGGLQLGIGLDEGEGNVLITRLSSEDYLSQFDVWNKQSCHEFLIEGNRS